MVDYTTTERCSSPPTHNIYMTTRNFKGYRRRILKVVESDSFCRNIGSGGARTLAGTRKFGQYR